VRQNQRIHYGSCVRALNAPATIKKNTRPRCVDRPSNVGQRTTPASPGRLPVPTAQAIVWFVRRRTLPVNRSLMSLVHTSTPALSCVSCVMPLRFALHRAEAVARCPSTNAKLSTCVLVILWVVTLAGCNDTTRGFKASNTGVATTPKPRTPVPLPHRELLKPPPDFKCEFETVDPMPDALRKLDYERQCYRHAFNDPTRPSDPPAGLGR
jgi:hypothetical protein